MPFHNFIKRYSLRLSLILFFSFPSILHASSLQPLQRALAQFAGDKDLKAASWAFMAVDTRSGKELLSHNPDLALSPASVQKLVTTITALDMLGDDFQYFTTLGYTGDIMEGELKGNLIIKGSGDPSLGSTLLHDSLSLDRMFDVWSEALAKAGIHRIAGHIIADGSIFDDFMVPAKWMWEDLGNYYGAGAHGLTLMENKYRVFFNPGARVGEAAKVVRTLPEVFEMEFVNDVTTGPARSGDRVYIYGAPYQNARWLTGTVPLGENNFAVRGSIPDPGHFLGNALKAFLQKKDMEIGGEVFTHRTSPNDESTTEFEILSQWHSPALHHICERTNMSSVNTYAENLLKTIGAQKHPQGSFSNGAEVIRDFWKEKGMDLHGLRIMDGSGLSPVNSITARQLAFMLQYAAQEEELLHALLPGLPIAGRSGSLSRMFLNTTSQNNLTAKSGFLSHVRSYAGYTHCKNGHRIAFVLIVNNYEGTPLQMRRKMEVLMNAISEVGL